MKYICLICDETFDELEIISNEEGFDICPYCLHSDIMIDTNV